MNKKVLKFLIWIGASIALTLTPQLLAQTGAETVDPVVDPIAGDDAVTLDDATESGSKFYSRERLSETLLGETQEVEPDEELEDPTDVLSENPTGESTDTTETVDTVDVSDDSNTEVVGGAENLEDPQVLPPTEEQVSAFVESLSDEQTFALNRSLNNVVSSGLPVVYDMELLQKIVDEDYNKQQINSLTKAIESEAKFIALAEKTGNDAFLLKALREKEKFLSKVERFRSGNKTAAKELRSTTKGQTKKAAREAGNDTIRNAAKNSVKQETKAAANEARKVARKSLITESKVTAKNAAKNVSKEVNRQVQKENKGQGKKA